MFGKCFPVTVYYVQMFFFLKDLPQMKNYFFEFYYLETGEFHFYKIRYENNFTLYKYTLLYITNYSMSDIFFRISRYFCVDSLLSFYIDVNIFLKIIIIRYGK